MPDLICCGKGMGNGYPLSGVIGKKNYGFARNRQYEQYSLSNPVACAVGLAVLEEINQKSY